MLVTVFSVSPVMAYDPVTEPDSSARSTTTTPSISPEEAQKIRAQLSELSKTLGNAPPTKDGKPTEAAVEKTMAGVADKALDMFVGVVGSVGDSLKKIAPDVWRIMIQKQYADAVCYVSVPFFIFIFIYVVGGNCQKWFMKIYHEDGQEHNDKVDARICSVIRTVLLTIVGLWLAIAAGVALRIVINPEYYAVKDLLNLIFSRGSSS